MSEYVLKGKKIKLYGDPESCNYAVEISGEKWTMTEKPFITFSDGKKVIFSKPESEDCFETGTTRGIGAVYSVFGEHKIKVHTKAEIEIITDNIFFTVQVDGDEKCEIETVSFPAPFDFGKAYGDSGENTGKNLPKSYTVLPRMQGTLVPAETQIKIACGRIFERDAYMPIFGQVRENTGYLAVYDTPYDAKYELRYENGGEKTAPLWVSSLGYMAYPRKMIYSFMENCDYNDFAKAYRSYVKQKGRLVTLREKIARNPKVEKLLGCPIIHSTIAAHISPDSEYYKPDDPEHNDYFTSFRTRSEQIRKLSSLGVEKAYTHFDGWGNHGYDNLHPDPFPVHEASGGADGMRELARVTTGSNFIFGIHDQYRDYYYDAPSFSLENAVMYADGTHPFCSIWFGGKHSYLCSSVARDYVRRNYAVFEELGIDIEAAYLDVFSVVYLDECFNPSHPATREQCARYRSECLEILTDRGIIPSSEEILDCILPSQVLCHHAPFFTTHLGESDSKSVGINIPLLNLVYHDCAVIPWIGRKNKKGGWGIPGSDSGYAYACLCGNPLYLSIEADEDEISEITEVCRNAEKLALCTIEKHEFVSEDRRIQRTTFSDGTVVTVNFDTDEIDVK